MGRRIDTTNTHPRWQLALCSLEVALVLWGQAGLATAALQTYYPMEGSGTVIVDQSGNSNNATMVGVISRVSRTDDSAFGNALSFNATDYVRANSNYLGHRLTNMTLSAWIKPDALNTWRTIFRRGENGQLNYRLQLFPISVNWVNFDFDTESHGWQNWLCQTCSVPSGVWSHLAVTYDVATSKGKIYINGVLKGTKSYPAGTTPKATGTLLPLLSIGRDIR